MGKNEEYEIWENLSNSTIWVNKTDHKGEVGAFKVVKGAKLQITPADRLHENQERIRLAQKSEVAAKLDPFENGSFVPVALLDSSDDLEDNPNHLSRSEIEDMFTVRNYLQFKASLKEITAPGILTAMLAMAEDDSRDATVGQIKAIKERIEELGEQNVVIDNLLTDTSFDDFGSVPSIQAS